MAQKRHFEGAYTNGDGPEDKRQHMNRQSLVLEPELANITHKLWVVLEPMLRKVVSEEVERVIAKYFSLTKSSARLPSTQLQGLESTSLHLEFQNKLALPLYTGSRVEGEHGNPIQVSLQDAVTGQIVVIDDESLLKLDVVVLEGDFASDEAEDWTYEDFESHMVKERDGKRPLLAGDVTISLQGGKGILGELIFTDNSSWIRSRKFRLGVRVANGMYKGIRVREAITEAVFVKDHRGQLYKKHYPPNLNDDVWRLEKIGKDGAYHKRLLEFRVNTVKDFLVMYATGPSRLREIFGATMSTKTWDSIIEHAKTTILNDAKYVYYPNENRKIGVVMDTIYQPLGILRNELYVPGTSLSDTEQVYMDRLVQEAYKNLGSLCKFSSRGHSEELDAVCRSEKAHLAQCVPPFTESTEKQHLQYQRFKPNSIVAQSTTGYISNVAHDNSLGLTAGTVPKKNVYANSFPSGMLESLVFHDNHLQKDTEPIYDEGIELPQLQYLNDYTHGRTFPSVGDDELFVLSGLSTGLIPSAAASEDGRYLISRRYAAQNPVFDEKYLHRRAYICWVKLKAVYRFVFVTKKGLASRRPLKKQQLN